MDIYRHCRDFVRFRSASHALRALAYGTKTLARSNLLKVDCFTTVRNDYFKRLVTTMFFSCHYERLIRKRSNPIKIEFDF